jgi:hypothetical protein
MVMWHIRIEVFKKFSSIKLYIMSFKYVTSSLSSKFWDWKHKLIGFKMGRSIMWVSENKWIKTVDLKIRVMLTYALRSHVKVLKNRNIAFNDIKYLMFKELNTPQVQ